MSSTAPTIRHGVKADTDAKVVKTKLSLNRTRPYTVLAVGVFSSADTSDSPPFGDRLLYLDTPSDMPGADAHRRVLERSYKTLCQSGNMLT